MQLRLTFFFASLITLALVHIVAIEFFFYWLYLWIDIPVHVLGGVTVALGIGSLPFFNIQFFEPITRIAPILIGVFVVGVIWELFEVLSGTSLITDKFIGDTVLDLCMDVFGGAIGFYILRSLNQLD